MPDDFRCVDFLNQRYRLLRQITGTDETRVMEARDILFPEKRLAVKLVNTDSNKINPDQFGIFFRNMASARHENLVRHLDFGKMDAGRILYYSMEFVEFTPYREIKGDLSRLVSLAVQLCDVLAYLHSSNLLVADLTPANVLIQKNQGTVKLLNYGFECSPEGIAVISRKRSIHSLAPELIREEIADHRIDLYALGVLLYEIATGKKPFNGTVGQILKKHISSYPENTGLNHKLDRIISRLLAKSPQQRYSHAADVLEDIRKIDVPGRFRLVNAFALNYGKFVGRQAELQRLRDVYAACAQGAGGKLVLLSGLDGIGKQRLLEEFKADLAGRCEFVFLFDSFPDCLRKLDEVTAWLVRQQAAASGSDTGPDTGGVSGESRHIQSINRFLAVTESVPVVILIRKIDADQEIEWRALEFLVAHLSSSRSMLCTMCPAGNPTCEIERIFPMQHSQIERISVSLLKAPEVGNLVRSLIGAEIPEELLTMLMEISGGNPLYIRKTLQRIIDRHGLERVKGEWVYFSERLSLSEIAQPVSENLKNLLRELTSDARELLEIISVADRPLRRSDLSALVERNRPEAVSHVIDRLIGLSLLTETESDSGAEIKLTFPTLSNAIYRKIDSDRLLKIHSRIAGIIALQGRNPEEIAHHYIRAGAHLKAPDAILSAIDYCISAGSFQRAEFWINTAFENIHDFAPVTRGLIYYNKAHLSLLMHRSDDVIFCAKRALELLPEAPEFVAYRGRLFQFIGQISIRRCDFHRANRDFQDGIREFGDVVSKIVVSLNILIAKTLMNMGNIRRALRRVQIAERIAEQLDDVEEKNFSDALIISAYGEIRLLKGDIRKAEDDFTRVMALSDRQNYTFYRVYIRNKLASLYLSIGNSAAAGDVLATAESLCKEAGLMQENAITLRLQAMRKQVLSEYAAAEDMIEQAINLNRRINRKSELLRCQLEKAVICRYRGRLKEAQEILRGILSAVANNRFRILEIRALTWSGIVFLDQSALGHAENTLNRALQLSIRKELKSSRGLIFHALATLYWRFNHRVRAKAYVKKLLGWLREVPDKQIEGLCHLLRAKIAKLERRIPFIAPELEKAGQCFKACGAVTGLLQIELVKLRNKMDREVSFSVYREARRLWETVRKSPDVQLKLEGGLIIAKLMFRRNAFDPALRIADLTIGLAVECGFREIAWRGLRIRSQTLEAMALYDISRDALNDSWAGIMQIINQIPSDSRRRSYLSRPDVGSVQSARDEFMVLHGQAYSPDQSFPALMDSYTEDRSRIAILGEQYRIFQTASRKIRASLDREQISTYFLEAALKLTGSERVVLFAQSDEADLRPVSHRWIGSATPLDITKLADSSILQHGIRFGELISSSNIQIDDRFLSDPFARELGLRAVLCVPLKAHTKIVGALYLDTRLGNADQLISSIELMRELSEETALSLENARLYGELDEIFIGMVRALASAVDAKDPYTAGHSARVAEYTLMIGKELDFDQKELRELELAAFLHDIGKIGIAQSILDQSTGLEADQKAIIRTHPEIAAKILSPVKKFRKVWTAVLQHHERYDGKGYPNGLKGKEIHIYARILSVADALDAMTTDRPYQKAVPIPEAVAEINRNAGTQFDPEIASALQRLVLRKAVSIPGLPFR